MDELEQLYTHMLVNISERYKQTGEFIESIMDKVAYHESRRDPECKQLGGGPGRGLFQFETGASEGGETAMNRLLRWLKVNQIDAPDWAGPQHQADTRIQSFQTSMNYYPGAVL